MLDKDLLRKLDEEQPLSVADALRLDEALEADDTRCRGLLTDCEDAAPSFAWRSELNQRLATTRRAPKLKLLVGWAGGLTAVAASALVLFMNQTPVQNPSRKQVVANDSNLAAHSSFEDALISSHMQGAAQSSVGATPVQETNDPVFDWSKLDKS